MANVITRKYLEDDKGRYWYYFECFCGHTSNRFLSMAAMINSSNSHRTKHVEHISINSDEVQYKKKLI